MVESKVEGAEATLDNILQLRLEKKNCDDIGIV